eukprot:838369-Pyramimonas_sp.AAC.1
MARDLFLIKIGHVREFLHADDAPVDLSTHKIQPPRGTFERNSPTIPRQDDGVAAGCEYTLSPK